MENPSSSSTPSKLKIACRSLQAGICLAVVTLIVSPDARDGLDKHVLSPLIGKALGIDPNMDTDHAPYIPFGPW
ncbi:hypothetical protein KA071_01815 [Candidatus Gracilibacteria bacterium]|nr:hypothetical protein [Candidatus Gracilibacteria bacterium]